MLTLYRFLRFSLTLVVSFVLYCCAIIHTEFLPLWGFITKQRGSFKYRKSYWSTTWWIRVVATQFLMRGLLGLKIDFQINREGDRGRPLLVISNHRSVLDIPIVFNVVGKVRRCDLRCIFKDNLRKTLIIGAYCKETESAFVSRKGDMSDLIEVKRAAAITKLDGASMLIFPEGTRYKDGKKTPYKHLLRPHKLGFSLLCAELPDYDILSITLDWKGDATKARTLFQNMFMVGARLVVTAKFHVLGADAGQWIEEEWQRKDVLLTG